jgi:hypothetical protein
MNRPHLSERFSGALAAEEAAILQQPGRLSSLNAMRSLASWSDLLYWFALCLTFLFALALRARGVNGHFPLFDGGLFYTMIGDLHQNGYRLPEFTTYNGGDIPFSYPPLAFYFAAVLEDVLHIERLTILINLPAYASAGTVVAFYFLARGILRSRGAVLIATFAFAVLPHTFVWFIVGGGLTRSLGFLFALLALSQILRCYTTGHTRYVLTAGALVGLTILTHLEMTFFLFFSALVISAYFGRSRAALSRSVIIALMGAVIASPWWITLMLRDGIDPWLSTGSSRSMFSPDVLGTVFLTFRLTAQPLFDVMGILGVAGLFICLLRRNWFLPTWLFSVALLMPWMLPRLGAPALSLLVAVAVTELIAPMLKEAQIHPVVPRAMAVVFVVYGALAGIHAAPQILSALSVDELDAMRWSEANTPEASRFLVVDGREWGTDHIAEWFPVLAARKSVGTMQGTEWLGGFNKRVRVHEELERCRQQDAGCLEDLESVGWDFTHVYVSREVPRTQRQQSDDCCRALREALRRDPHYQLVYDGPGASIFARVP